MVNKCPKCGADNDYLLDIVAGNKVITECTICLYHFDDDDDIHP